MLKTKLGLSSDIEFTSLHAFQEVLNYLTILVHHNPSKVFWIDLDTLKEFSFEAVAFHTATDDILPKNKWSTNALMQPILFLSRLFTMAEKNY